MTNAPSDPYAVFEELVQFTPAPYCNWTPAKARTRSLQNLFVPSVKIGSQRSPAYYNKQNVLDFAVSKWGQVHPSLIDKMRAAWGLEPTPIQPDILQPKRKKAKPKAKKKGNRNV
jgi:hypothetical protein